MARCEFSGTDGMENILGQLSRETVKKCVMAGADACVEQTKTAVQQYRHVVTGNRMNSVQPGKYHEDLGSGWVEVYPQGYDSRGISNAKKAFVINYGYGGRRTDRTGDKFITGNKTTMQDVVSRAMQAESDRLVQQMTGG